MIEKLGHAGSFWLLEKRGVRVGHVFIKLLVGNCVYVNK